MTALRRLASGVLRIAGLGDADPYGWESELYT